MSAVHEVIAAGLEEEIWRAGSALWRRVQRELPGASTSAYWKDLFLDWAMREAELKVSLFQLTDVLPTLTSDAQVAEHVVGYLRKYEPVLPMYLRGALRLAHRRPLHSLVASAFRSQTRRLGRRFIIGNNVHEALPALRRMWREGFASTADLLGERTLSATEAQAYEHRYLQLIDLLSRSAESWPELGLLESTPWGPIPRANVSIKVSALEPSLNPLDPSGSVERLRTRLLPLLLHAREHEVFVNLDMEQWTLHEIVYRSLENCLAHPRLKQWPHVGVVVQAYLKCAHDDAERMLALAVRRNAPITVRLVKGAYWDYEVAMSRQSGVECPVYVEKAATDANFEALTRFLLEHSEHLRPAFGTHNLRSIAHAVVQAQRLSAPRSAFEIQMLYGMAEAEQKALRALGHRVRLYTPIGEIIPGMAYLVRRLLENTSNEGFMRLAYRERLNMSTLLRRPEPKDNGHAEPQQAEPSSPPVFRNCPLLDFTREAVREAFVKAVDSLPASFPRVEPVNVNGAERRTPSAIEHFSPNDQRLCIARMSMAAPADVEDAVSAAAAAWPSWRDKPVPERAAVLEALADRLEDERIELAALQVHEVGKPWSDADADVAEAIDYCRYYARQAVVELGPQPLPSVPGERNALFYEGRGPTAVIAPWNFPLAILCGMTTAALVSGNTVVMKPAEQSSACAYALYRHLLAAGVPQNAVQFVPGDGETVGGALVGHPDIAVIAFTGSMEVGLSILERAARTAEGQRHVKSVVCEMGGKNAVIVDEDADLDEAVAGVMLSAFSYAGQKCSACSRVIAVGDAAGPFTRRLIEACRRLILAPANDPACELGPVIDGASRARLLEVIAARDTRATLLYLGPEREDGCFVPPAIFLVSDRRHPLMQYELFGPVLALMHVKDIEEALDVAMSTSFALTGGLYSRNPANIKRARQRFRVGNLYINRSCTGARVGRQPFGGFGMSGTGTKAGGPGYLRHFAVPRCVTENTMRKGFAPEIV